MSHDPVLIADTQEWLRRAAEDLRAVDVDLVAAPPLLADALFHCQQAVEKAFKGFLTFHNLPFRRTHNLEEIGAACLTIDASLQATVAEAVPLSEYAWAYRYPGHPAPPDPAEVTQARSRRTCMSSHSASPSGGGSSMRKLARFAECVDDHEAGGRPCAS